MLRVGLGQGLTRLPRSMVSAHVSTRLGSGQSRMSGHKPCQPCWTAANPKPCGGTHGRETLLSLCMSCARYQGTFSPELLLCPWLNAKGKGRG